jgi:phosphoribosyl-ATP pyrophosphohydrolase
MIIKEIIMEVIQERLPSDIPTAAVVRVDTTLDTRETQIPDPMVDSPTLSLLRDPNKAGKKFGEEQAEFLMAVCGEADAQDCEAELADVVRAALVFARSKGKRVRLSGVVTELIQRNRQMSPQESSR